MTAAGVPRSELAEYVRGYRERGYLNREIAAKLGISVSYVSELYVDPDGSKSKARKDGYRGTCEECGAPTSGCNGFNAPKLCAKCAPLAAKIWTREAIIDAIQRWAAAHDGRPPRATDWVNADLKRHYPASSSVYGPTNVFGAWADAIEAAGFERPRVGKREDQRHWDSPEIVLDAIRASARDGVAISSDDDPSLQVVGRRFFGSWVAACEAAGVLPCGHSRENIWTRESIVEAIRRLAIDDMPPTAIENTRLSGAAIYHFGSWKRAVRAAGFKPYGRHGGAHDARAVRRRAILASREARRLARQRRAAGRARARP